MVEIAAGLRRAARRTEGPLGVLVRSSAAPQVTAAAVRAAVLAAERSDDEVDRATPLEIQETTKGPAVVLTDALPDDMLPVLERLAERLSETGLADATLTVMPTVNPFGRDAERQMAAIKCWMVLRGARPPGWTGPKGWGLDRPYWDVSQEDQQSALAQLVDWAVSLPVPGAVAAATGGEKYVPLPLADAVGFMQRSLERPTIRGNSHLVVTAGTQVRSVDLLRHYGVAAASQGVRNGAALDWREEVEQTRRVLQSVGPWCAHAHLTRGYGTMSLSALFPDGDRTMGNPWASRARDWAEFISGGGFVDAYGVMRLPGELASRVDSLWQVSPLPNGQILAEHPDPAAWFAAPRIDALTLERARSVLGNALLDRSGETIRV